MSKMRATRQEPQGFGFMSRLRALLRTASAILLLVYVQGGAADPALAPELQFRQFRSQEVQPLLEEAAQAPNASTYTNLVEMRAGQLKAGWEAESFAKIQNALMSIDHSDTFNDVEAYRQHVESLLVAQQEEAWNNYWAAMRTELDAGQQAYMTKLSEGSIRITTETRMQEASEALSITNNPANPWDDVRSSLDRAHRDWERQYLAELQEGVLSYERSVYALQTEFQNYNAGMQNTDQDFQRRLAEMQASEARVRSGIGTQVDGLDQYLQASNFFYEETCDDQYNCAVDRTKMSASGLELQTLIASMRKQIAENAPLSEMSRQMRDYLAARREEAREKEQHWVQLSTGQADYASATALPARSQQEWAFAQGRPYATGGGDGYGEAIASVVLLLTDTFGTYGYSEAAYQRQTSQASVIANYLDNRSSVDAQRAAMDFVSQRGETRTITGIENAEITGAVSGSRYSTQGVEAFIKRQSPDALICITLANASVWAGLACAISQIPVPETSLNVSVQYTWKDENATHNAQSWATYGAELETATASWDNMLIPAVQNWEAQVAAYKEKYEQWKLDAAAAGPIVQQRYNEARQQLVQAEAQYINRMDDLWRQGEGEWSVLYRKAKEGEKAAGWKPEEFGYGSRHDPRTAAEIAAEKKAASATIAALLKTQPAINKPDYDVASDYSIAHQSLYGSTATGGAAGFFPGLIGKADVPNTSFNYLLHASEGSPDLRLMDYMGTAFSQSITGAQNFGMQAKQDSDVLRERNKVIDQLRQAAEQNYVDLDYSTEYGQKKRDPNATSTSNGFKTEVLEDGRVRATRKIATGRAILKAGADATKAEGYEAEMTDQVIYLAPPEVQRLANTSGLFDTWDEEEYFSEIEEESNAFSKTADELFSKAGNELYNANSIATGRLNDFSNDRSTQASNASQFKSLITTLMTGGTINSYFIDTYKGQIGQALESFTGIPAGLWSAFSGGGSFKESMTAYLEGCAWQNLEKATGLEGSTAFFKQYIAKAKANQARHEAGRVHMEDMALGYAGALTYTWRNAEYRPGLKRTVETAEVVVFTALQVVGSIIPAVGNAAAAGITAGYYAAKNAYVGSLKGGTKGALAGGVSGAVTGVTQQVGINIGAEYSFENGYSGSIGVGKEVGGVNLGVSAQMQDGKGVTGYGFNIGKSNAAHTAGVGLGFNFAEGKYTGANITGNAGKENGAGIFGGFKFDRSGYSGTTLGVRNSANKPGVSTNASVGVTLNKDKSTDTQVSVSGSLGDPGQSGFNSIGAGATTTFHKDKEGKTTTAQHVQIYTTYQTDAAAAKYAQERLKATGGRTASERARDDANEKDANERSRKEGQDLAAGVANVATRGKDELAAAAGGVQDLGDWWDTFTGDIEDAIGGFGESVANVWKHGSFETTEGLVAQAQQKALDGIRPGMTAQEQNERYAANVAALTSAEREFLNSASRGGGAETEQMGGSSDVGGEAETMGLDKAAMSARAIVGITNSKYFQQTGKNLLIPDNAAGERLLNEIVNELRELEPDGNYTDEDVMYVAQMHGANLSDAISGNVAAHVGALQRDAMVREQARAAEQRRAAELAAAPPVRTGQVSVGEALWKSVFPDMHAAANSPPVQDQRITPTEVVRGIWNKAYDFDLLTAVEKGWSGNKVAMTAIAAPIAYGAATIEAAANTLGYLYEDTKGNYLLNPIGTLMDMAVDPVQQGLGYLEDNLMAPDGSEHPAWYGTKKFGQGLVGLASGAVSIVDNPMNFIGEVSNLVKTPATRQGMTTIESIATSVGDQVSYDWEHRGARDSQQRLAGLAGTGLSLAAAFLLPAGAARLRRLSAEFGTMYEAAVAEGAVESGLGRVTPEVTLVNPQARLPRVRFSTETIEALGPAPSGMKNPHRHHTLEVNGRPGDHRALVREGQEILRSYEVEPLEGLENLVWAPNKGHTISVAKNLVEELRILKQLGADRELIVDTLRRYAQQAARR